jgi:hypothetical protein
MRSALLYYVTKGSSVGINNKTTLKFKALQDDRIQKSLSSCRLGGESSFEMLLSKTLQQKCRFKPNRQTDNDNDNFLFSRMKT